MWFLGVSDPLFFVEPPLEPSPHSRTPDVAAGCTSAGGFDRELMCFDVQMSSQNPNLSQISPGDSQRRGRAFAHAERAAQRKIWGARHSPTHVFKRFLKEMEVYLDHKKFRKVSG